MNKKNTTGKIVYPDTIYETVVEFVRGDKTITVSSTDSVWVRKIKKLYEQNPDGVIIVAENEDGSICARLPKEYLKLSRPRSCANMTEEQRKAAAERLKKSRLSKTIKQQ